MPPQGWAASSVGCGAEQLLEQGRPLEVGETAGVREGSRGRIHTGTREKRPQQLGWGLGGEPPGIGLVGMIWVPTPN